MAPYNMEKDLNGPAFSPWLYIVITGSFLEAEDPITVSWQSSSIIKIDTIHPYPFNLYKTLEKFFLWSLTAKNCPLSTPLGYTETSETHHS